MPIVLGGCSEGKDSQNDEELHGQAGLMMVPLMGGFYIASQVGLGDDCHLYLKYVLLIHLDGLLGLLESKYRYWDEVVFDIFWKTLF